jgi:hypothetical protein
MKEPGGFEYAARPDLWTISVTIPNGLEVV